MIPNMYLEGKAKTIKAVIKVINKMNDEQAKAFPGREEKIISFSSEGTKEKMRILIYAEDVMLFYKLGASTLKLVRDL